VPSSGIVDLKVGQDFQQKRFECIVGTIELVDQEERRSGGVGRECFEQRTLDEKFLREDIGPPAVCGR
jgi:hypothetical protein